MDHLVRQDLSVAGKRAGLAGERSGLFMEQVRIVKEQRAESEKRFIASEGENFDKTKIKPRYMIWENVCQIFDTLITTSTGLKKIGEVEVGDMVRTHDGTYHKVVQTFKTEMQPTIKVKYQGGEVTCTPNHPYLTEDMTYKPIGEFKVGDRVGFKVDEPGTKSIGMPIAYAFGRWLADGSVAIRNDRKTKHRIFISTGYKKYESLKAELSKLPWRINEQKMDWAINFTFSSDEFGALTDDAGYGARNKQVPEWVFDLVAEERDEVLRGYLAGDGHCYKKENSEYCRWSFATSSEKLAYGLARLVRAVYHIGVSVRFEPGKGKVIIDGREVNAHDFWRCEFTPPHDTMHNIIGVGNASKYDAENGYVWCCIRDISEGEIQDVYNLSVEDNNTYETNGIICHNCGAYSSGDPGGSDFQAVLEEICKVVRHDCPIVPIPKDGWPLAGNLDGVGDDGTPFSICWRTHDAQYWGVPQRRRRIALVADFGGSSAPEILFESNSLSGNTQESRETREGTSGDSANSIGSTSESARESVTAFGISSYDSNAMKSDNPNSGIYEADSARTLDLNGGNPACNQGGIAIVQNSEPTDAIGCDIYNSAVTGDVAASLTAQGSLSAGGSGPSIIVNTPDSCLKQEPVLLESNQNHATVQTDGISTTLPASMGEGGGYVPMVAIEGNGTRDSHKGDGYAETETMYTLNTVEQHAVAYGIDQQCGKGQANYTQDVTPTSAADSHGTPHAVAYAVESHAQDARYNVGDTNQTLGASMEHDPANGGLVLCSDVHGFQGQVGATVSLPIDKELSPTMVRNQIPDAVYATQACGDRDNSGQSFSAEVAYTIPANPMSDRGQAVVQSVQSMELFHCTSEEELAAPLKARDYKDPQVVAFEPGAASRVGGHVYTDGKAGTLRAEMGDNQQAICQSTVYSIDQGAGKSGCNFDVNRAPTLTTTHGGEPVVLNDQGGDNAPLVFGRQHDVTDDNITPSLCAKMGTGGNNVPCVLNTDPQSIEDSSVVFENHSQDTRYNELGEVCQTVSATWGMGGNNQPLEVKPQQAIVRRLTPLECERLQGFPDYWTHIGDWVDSKGKKHKDSDSPKYKALGNSIALPFWYWMAGRMVAQLKKSGVEHPTMASLFDGIAGFPYVYIRHGCMPLWTSEIEEFPMAVCRKHFGDEETGEVGDIGEYLKLPPNWKSAATSGEGVTDSTVAFDRATFNQGANAKYDFSVEQGVAQTLLSRGPGGVCQCDLNADVIGSLCASDYKGIRNQDIDDGKAILQPNE